METQEAPVSPVYAVYFPADLAKSPLESFHFLGARFNRFGTPKEAMDFFASGEIRAPQETTTPVIPSEPIIPFPSVSRYQMNDLKKAIEKGTVEAVSDLIDSNPRFLVNTSGDTAAIVMEGFRFNALHIAARHGKAGVVEKILQLIGDKRFLAVVYGTNEDDAQDGQIALDVVCSRYAGDDRRKRKEEIELLIGGFFVAVYRSTDNTLSPKIVVSEDFPKFTLSNDETGLSLPLLWEFKLTGCAGPFGSEKKATEFLNNWVGFDKHIKLSDNDKGYERVGRELSEKSNVKWVESWCFLDRMVDLRSEEGLTLLNCYLSNLKQKNFFSRCQSNGLERRLSFEDSDDQRDQLVSGSIQDYGENEFKDALEFVDEADEIFNGSLAGLSVQFGALSLHSPSAMPLCAECVLDDLEDFFTPPSTPPVVFLLDNPTKVDNDVMTALSGLPQEKV
ncbi:unnamed protein product [Angiostrongylus costaricensis]|uniref:ANK_REP_REGION domain-containing protein n=1 Tax=Angiostrongylus costaricensis TaxID=334426 RepID=A0A0R3PDD2_ANGCS|nr:unnamed protein product [Angiostrongylus costaricensis]